MCQKTDSIRGREGVFVPRQLQQFTSPHLEDDTALVLGGVPGSDNGDRCEVGWWWGCRGRSVGHASSRAGGASSGLLYA